MLHFALEDAFDDLLTSARVYHERRCDERLPVVEQARLRIALDNARRRMRYLRLALAPERHELEAFSATVWCDVLESVVHLRTSDDHCPCGGPL